MTSGGKTVQCSMETPEGRPADSILSRMSMPVSQGRSISAHRSLALLRAMDILHDRDTIKEEDLQVMNCREVRERAG